MSTRDKSPSLFDAAILKPALVASFVKLHPRDLMKNPVMFTVELVALVATVLMVRDTITLGNRHATQFIPVQGVDENEVARVAQLASLADETPEGRSIVVLAKDKYGLRGVDVAELGGRFVAFTAQTRMSGVDHEGAVIRKGAVDAVVAHARSCTAISGPSSTSRASSARCTAFSRGGRPERGRSCSPSTPASL